MSVWESSFGNTGTKSHIFLWNKSCRKYPKLIVYIIFRKKCFATGSLYMAGLAALVLRSESMKPSRLAGVTLGVPRRCTGGQDRHHDDVVWGD